MFLSVLFFILSIIPSVLIIVLLRRRKKDDDLYKKSCNSAILRGFIAVLPILLVSAILFVLNAVLKLTLFKSMSPLIYQLVYTFVVLAFAEEFVKYAAFKLLLKKRFNPYTWADVVAFMVIIGTMFGLAEDVPYAIGASPIIMLVRGFTMGHVGYGFIMGWFYGKSLYTGEKKYKIIAFILPLFIHGLYDFSLSEEFIKLGEYAPFVGVSLAVLDIVLIILMIRFFVRSKKIDRYNEAFVEAVQVEPKEAAVQLNEGTDDIDEPENTAEKVIENVSINDRSQ